MTHTPHRATPSLREGSRNAIGCVDVVVNGRGDVVAAAVWLQPGAWEGVIWSVYEGVRGHTDSYDEEVGRAAGLTGPGNGR